MKNVTYILLLFSLTLFSQVTIVRPSTDFYKADSIKNRTDLSRAIIDGVNDWIKTGKDKYIIHQPDLILKFESQKIVLDSVTDVMLLNTVNSCSDTIKRYIGLFNDSSSFSIETDTTDVQGFPLGKFRQMNLRYYYDSFGGKKYLTKIKRIKPDPVYFYIDTTYVQKLESTRIKTRTWANLQNQVIKLEVGTDAINIIEVIQSNGFTATDLKNGLFQHGRWIENLQPNTNYFYIITLRDKLGNEVRSDLTNFKTLE